MVKKIFLSNNKGITLVDNEDYNWLLKYNWHLQVAGNGYAQTSIKVNNIWVKKRLHQLLLNVPVGYQIDHIDRNSLNNQRNNLRIVTNQQNQMNKSKQHNSNSMYKGVGWYKNYNKWSARITLNKKVYFLGYFKNEIEAAKAYNNKAKKLFGEYANLNNINGE